MSKEKTYAEKLKDPRWQRKRLTIMKRDRWKCRFCGTTKDSLQVHHVEYINGNEPWDYPDNLLITLCEDCHKEVDVFKNSPVINKTSVFDITVFKRKFENNDRLMISAVNDRITIAFHKSTGEFIYGAILEDENIVSVLKILQKAIRNGKR